MLTSWFAIPYNLEGLNSDCKTVYHTGLDFNLSLDTVFLYRRQMTRFLCLPGIVFLVLFMEGAGLSRILASYKRFGTGSLPSVTLRPGYFLLQTLVLLTWPLGHDSIGSILEVLVLIHSVSSVLKSRILTCYSVLRFCVF